MEHLADGDGDGAGVAKDGRGERVSHKNQIDAGGIGMAGGGIVISGEADDLALALERLNSISGPFRGFHGREVNRNGVVGQVLCGAGLQILLENGEGRGYTFFVIEGGPQPVIVHRQTAEEWR